MPQIDAELLEPVVIRYVGHGGHLTPSERAEVSRIAQGLAGKDAAAATNVSPETIRARRKRIYRKLKVAGAGELISSLLATALAMLAHGQRGEGPETQAFAQESRVELSSRG